MNAAEALLTASKIVLLSLCVFSTTNYAHPASYIEFITSLHGGRLLQLTNLAQYLTIFTLFTGHLTKTEILKSQTLYKDSLVVAFCLEGIVTTMFWSLMAINPRLVKGPVAANPEDRPSLLTEVSLHLLPFVLLLLEQRGVQLEFRMRHILYIAVFTAAYFLFLWHNSIKNGNWEYPFIDEMDMPYRVLFFVAAVPVALVFYSALLCMSRTQKATN